MTPLEIAIAEIGYTENPRNSNKTKYGEWYNWNGVPWCMIFVQWCFYQAGYKLPIKSASCSGVLNWYKIRFPEKLISKPQPNDIVIYNFGHTGILEKDNGDGKITVIEGNTSPDNRGSQDNGGGVYCRVRNKTLVEGYIRAFDIKAQEEDYMIKAEILKELDDQYIEKFEQLPKWARVPIRELLDEGIINGGTEATEDADDINMFLSDIKSIVVMKRLIDKK